MGSPELPIQESAIESREDNRELRVSKVEFGKIPEIGTGFEKALNPKNEGKNKRIINPLKR